MAWGSASKKYERSLEKTMAMRARLRSVGTTRPVSSCERKLADRPVCLPSSTRPMDFLRRRRLMRSPMCFSAMKRSVVSVSTWVFWVDSLETVAAVSDMGKPSSGWGTPGDLLPRSKSVLMVPKPGEPGKLKCSGEAKFRMTQKGVDGSGKVLLSGASGMLGSALREALRAEGAEIIHLVRREPAHEGEMRWDGDGGINSDEKLRRLEGVAGAIHLLGGNVGAARWDAAHP